MNYKLRITNYGLVKRFFFLGILLSAVYCIPLTVTAQKLDNMTEKEDMLIRDAEEMDDRMNIYVHIVDRRLLAATDTNAAQSKQAEKDLDKYGELRTGTNLKLFADIERTIEEAIGKIDDVAARDQKNPLFSKSVRILTKACERWQPQFNSLLAKVSDDKEKVKLENSIEECSQVIDASSKLPKDDPKTDKKKKTDSN